jgi:hypothetical protein
VTIRARAQDGEIFGISATVGAPDGNVSQRMPYATVETTRRGRRARRRTVTVPASATPFGTTVRYRLVSLGSALPETPVTITQPSRARLPPSSSRPTTSSTNPSVR